MKLGNGRIDHSLKTGLDMISLDEVQVSLDRVRLGRFCHTV